MTLESLRRLEGRAQALSPGPGDGPARAGLSSLTGLTGLTHLPLTLGLDDETFSPLRIDLAEAHHLVVAGPPRSGKSTLLATALHSSLDSAPGREARWYLATPRQSPLAELASSPHCERLVRDLPELADLVTELENEVAERRGAQAERDGAPSGAPDGPPQPRPPIFLVLDDYDVLSQDDEDEIRDGGDAAAQPGQAGAPGRPAPPPGRVQRGAAPVQPAARPAHRPDGGRGRAAAGPGQRRRSPRRRPPAALLAGGPPSGAGLHRLPPAPAPVPGGDDPRRGAPAGGAAGGAAGA